MQRGSSLRCGTACGMRVGFRGGPRAAFYGQGRSIANGGCAVGYPRLELAAHAAAPGDRCFGRSAEEDILRAA